MNGTNPKAPTVATTTSIRNVVLVGPSGSGKSRLFDHVVDAVVPGRSPRGGTEPTTGLRAATVDTGKVVLTLLDAPGNPDFVGEVRAGLRAADAALFVVSAADGADAQSRALWHECSIVGMPRAVVITQLDARDADFAATLEDCQAHFGSGIQPLGVPVPGESGAVSSIADLLLGEVHDYAGGRRTVRRPGPEHADVFESYRPALIEGIIEESEDGGLMDRYLEGEELDFETLEKDLLTAVAHGTFHPVLPLSAETGAGVGVLLHLVEAAFPHPGMHPLPTVTPVGGGAAVELEPDPDGPLVAEVVHTESDAYVGHLSLVRVFSGTLRTDRAVHVSGHLELLGVPTGEGHAPHDDDVRPGAVAAPFDGELLTKTQAIAGEVVVVTKLATAQTSDTISSPERPLLVTPWALPESLLPAAVAATSRADEDRMPVAFRELAAEDPSLRIEHDGATGQVVLWTTGSGSPRARAQPAPLAVQRRCRAGARQGRHEGDRDLARRGAGPPRQAVRRPRPVRGLPPRHGAPPPRVRRRVRRGRRGRRGSPPVLQQRREGGAPPAREGPPRRLAGRRRQGHPHRRQGPLGRLLGRRVPDGGGHRPREMASPSTICLLEPIDTVTVTVDDEHLGAVMTDIGTRRGQIVGSSPALGEPGRSVLEAAVPQLELLDYAITLRSLAHGTGTFHREHRGYEQLPERLVQDHLGETRRG